VPTLDPTDQQLLHIVSAAQPVTIADVIQVMQSIDALLPNNDGLKWFNKLYLMVTQEIDGQPPATAWLDAPWLTRLDVSALRAIVRGILLITCELFPQPHNR
jgi:Family of unknown function (DUF5995)